jgi:hypothetical protein
MSNQVIFFGWNRAVPGREKLALDHFQEFLGYLAGLQGSGAIDSYETVLLGAHGGDLNGFFLIRGNGEQITALRSSDEWLMHNVRAGHHLEGAGTIGGVTGDGVMAWMELYGTTLEKYG